ncbi:methyltransferase domain-containing protein [Kutzneria viridogrisea]|uniref:SAM-dependent methyltransferase n=1 Tax=Kutzneria viridogrisea TaxID=47990 RepID=A0ABR6BKM6_9PSEU|nr:SAM-dependent methyltransferase [Kutzneria viridogrisea]
MTSTRTGYVFDNDYVHAVDQHRYLTECYDALTCSRLAETGVSLGWRCWEIGAGGGSVADWLVRRVGPTGSVLATDIRPIRPYVHTHEVVHDPLPDGEFDLIHARLVLMHLPERDAVLRKLLRALRPSGWLQLDEPDIGYCPVLLSPDRRAAELYEAFQAAKEVLLAEAGADGTWGRKVAGAMAAAGFVAVDPLPVVYPWRAGSPGVRLQINHTHHLRDKLIAAGMTEQDLAEVRALLADERFRASSTVMYSVHGRRPL